MIDRIMVALLAVSLASCAIPPPPSGDSLVEAAQKKLHLKAVCCEALAQAPMSAKVDNKKPKWLLKLTEEAPVMLFDGKKTYFGLIDIGEFKGSSYVLRLQSNPSYTGSDRLLFPIKAEVLDQEFQRIKAYSGGDWLNRRGRATEGVISFSAESKARYLLVYADELGKVAKEDVSSISVTPIFVGVGVMMMPTGADQSISTYASPTGTVAISYEQ